MRTNIDSENFIPIPSGEFRRKAILFSGNSEVEKADEILRGKSLRPEVIVGVGECGRISASQMWVVVVPTRMFAGRPFFKRGSVFVADHVAKVSSWGLIRGLS